MEGMAKRYVQGTYVDTQTFVLDIEDRMFKQEQKDTIIFDLRKQIMLKNLKIEEVFSRAIPEISKFNIEHLSPEEFHSVFMFVESKMPLDKINSMLRTFFQADQYGKYSYKEFIKEYKNTEKTNA